VIAFAPRLALKLAVANHPRIRLMSANQPISDPGEFTVIENVLAAVPRPASVSPAGDGSDRHHTDMGAEWRALEDRIASWRPATAEPNIQTDEDGYVLPSSGTIELALQVAMRLREAGVGVPMWLAPGASGDIDFEWRGDNRAETITVNARSEIELMRFEGSKLVCRKAISLGPR
jgi:hypothetical protein